jgi:hypothetical protein
MILNYIGSKFSTTHQQKQTEITQETGLSVADDPDVWISYGYREKWKLRLPSSEDGSDAEEFERIRAEYEQRVQDGEIIYREFDDSHY